jgi:monoamine oxidase
MSAANPRSSDIVVVGAGLAGLTAAHRLAVAGAKVVVLEARGRVGGRTLSHALLDDTVDLGGQWLGPTQQRALALAHELGVQTFPQFDTGRKIMALGDRVRTYRGTIPAMALSELVELQAAITRADLMMLQVPPGRPWEARRAGVWDTQTVADWLARHVRGVDARASLVGAVRAVFAAEPHELSLLFFLAYLRSGGGLMQLVRIKRGAQQDRLAGGAQQLALRVAERLEGRIVLDAPALAVRQSRAGVVIETPRGPFRAGRAIIAVPPAVAEQIRFTPSLPPRRAELHGRMPMGAVIKCIVAYAEPFWRTAGLSGEVLSDSQPAQLVFDDSPHDGRFGALVAFILGDAARAWSRTSRAARALALCDQLVRWFGPRAAHPLAYLDHDWTGEPWSRGCYVGIMPPGALGDAGAALRRPCGLLHWAGTETAVTWNGYMDGAIESGERAAAEVLL